MNPEAVMWNIGFTGVDNDLIMLSAKKSANFTVELFVVNGYIKKAGDGITPPARWQVPLLSLESYAL